MLTSSEKETPTPRERGEGDVGYTAAGRAKIRSVLLGTLEGIQIEEAGVSSCP